MVKPPYLHHLDFPILSAALIFLTKLPEIQESTNATSGEASAKLSGTVAIPTLKGVIAQFRYVGAQVGVASFIIRFSEFTLPGTHEKAAARFCKRICWVS